LGTIEHILNFFQTKALVLNIQYYISPSRILQQQKQKREKRQKEKGGKKRKKNIIFV